jgi:hypothetical protein
LKPGFDGVLGNPVSGPESRLWVCLITVLRKKVIDHGTAYVRFDKHDRGIVRKARYTSGGIDSYSGKGLKYADIFRYATAVLVHDAAGRLVKETRTPVVPKPGPRGDNVAQGRGGKRVDVGKECQKVLKPWNDARHLCLLKHNLTRHGMSHRPCNS